MATAVQDTVNVGFPYPSVAARTDVVGFRVAGRLSTNPSNQRQAVCFPLVVIGLGIPIWPFSFGRTVWHSWFFGLGCVLFSRKSSGPEKPSERGPMKGKRVSRGIVCFADRKKKMRSLARSVL